MVCDCLKPPLALRRISGSADGRDAYFICNRCDRRWKSVTSGGYPQDEEVVHEEVTGRSEYDAFFTMDRTTGLALAAQRGDHEELVALLRTASDLEERSHIWELPQTIDRQSPLIAEGTPLMAAVYFAQETCVGLLLHRGADPNAKSRDLQTPLNIAVRLGFPGRFATWAPTLVESVTDHLRQLPEDAALRIVPMLLDGGADAGADSSRALVIAADRRDQKLLRLLLDSHTHARPGIDGALWVAVKRGDPETIDLLLERGAAVNAPVWLGRTPLMLAVADTWFVRDRRKELAELLVTRGADVNSRDTAGNTPLIHAASCESFPDLLRFLIERGAEINAANRDSETALMKAAFASREENVALLLQMGAEVDARDKNLRTALLLASGYGGNRRVVESLLDRGADHEARDCDGATPLIHAACWERVEVVRLLLARGAEIDAQSSCGRTALLDATMRSRLGTVAVLLEAGADVNLPDADGETPLTVGAWTGKVDLIRLLLDHGARATVRRKNGDSALDIAVCYRHRAAAELLRERTG